ncbi:MAG: HD domain-containing protein, partial [Treponema sp.]|nr:HD domain-containing protein [Treponema sp.]
LMARGLPFPRQLINSLTEWGFPSVTSSGKPSRNPLAAEGQTADEEEALLLAKEFCARLAALIEDVFDRFVTGSSLDARTLQRDFPKFLQRIRNDYRQLLMAHTYEPGDDFLLFQTLQTTIIAIIVGDAMRLDFRALCELGMAGILHDIGMLRMPEDIRLGRRTLTDDERKMVQLHPYIGYNALKSCGYPIAVLQAVLEHHERENGSGYPRQKAREGIHMYSKILAVSCSYAAISTDRPYREATDRHSGIIELMKNEGRQYNDKVMLALVQTLSVFPIGLHVMLSDGRKARVIDADAGRPYYPVVRVIGERNPDGSAVEVATSENGISIVRAIGDRDVEAP